MVVNDTKKIIKVLKVCTWGHGWWHGNSSRGQSGRGFRRAAYLLAREHLAKGCGIVLLVGWHIWHWNCSATKIGYRCTGWVCCFARTPWESFSGTGCAPCLRILQAVQSVWNSSQTESIFQVNRCKIYLWWPSPDCKSCYWCTPEYPQQLLTHCSSSGGGQTLVTAGCPSSNCPIYPEKVHFLKVQHLEYKFWIQLLEKLCLFVRVWQKITDLWNGFTAHKLCQWF